MYFVQEGICRILKMDEVMVAVRTREWSLPLTTSTLSPSQETGKQQELSRVEKGGYFGELALITHKARAASVYAATPEVKLACKWTPHLCPSLAQRPFAPFSPVLDVHAFERLLGPCMDIMKRNFNHYEDQLVKLFGSKSNVADLR